MHPERPSVKLSEREQQLLKLASEGLTDTAIAHRLGISEATVGTYWGRVRIKLGPHSRTELVATMLRAEREAAIDALKRENEHLVSELQAQGAEGSVLFYRTLLENAPDAILLVAETGQIEYANLAAAELFGYGESEIAGLDLTELIPARFRDRHRKHREEYVTDPQRRKMGEHLETPALGQNGKEFPIRASLSSIQTQSGLVIMCAIRASA